MEVYEVNYLRIKFNHRLTCQEHILDRIKHCKGMIVRLHAGIRARWSPSPRLMLWAFNRLVVPNLKPLSLVVRECNLATFTILSERPTWDGLGQGRQKGHRRFWGDLCWVLKLNNMQVDGKRFGQNWHPPARLDKNAKTGF